MLVSLFSSSSLSALLFSFLHIRAHTSLDEANTGENRATTRQDLSNLLKQWAETSDLLLKHGAKMAHVTKDRMHSGSRSNENMQFWRILEPLANKKAVMTQNGHRQVSLLSSSGWVWSLPMLLRDSTLPEGIFTALLWVMQFCSRRFQWHRKLNSYHSL